ncbi:hypothetical protein E4U60_006204 [Claviceps pazoutovae]|uniref:Uncharacterized protein n=1 Tax=Claviceps pazoutovae TaxID=1649127 RepID=A0A9P7M6Y8_9HYPO|nr:hypothetical protein E4U60_006204 [Claviceps pazoutovae]
MAAHTSPRLEPDPDGHVQSSCTCTPATFSDNSSPSVPKTDLQRDPVMALSKVTSARSARSLVSEVRDGVLNQRDLERGGGHGGHEKNGLTREDNTSWNPDLVEWDGPDDPQRPTSWAVRRKWAAVLCGTS